MAVQTSSGNEGTATVMKGYDAGVVEDKYEIPRSGTMCCGAFTGLQPCMPLAHLLASDAASMTS